MKFSYPSNPRKVTTIKHIKRTLENYEGRYLKLKEFNGSGAHTTHFVSVNFDEWYFDTREELLAWATFYFWNREMSPAGTEYWGAWS